jgi:hypothetical protein
LLLGNTLSSHIIICFLTTGLFPSILVDHSLHSYQKFLSTGCEWKFSSARILHKSRHDWLVRRGFGVHCLMGVYLG